MTRTGWLIYSLKDAKTNQTFIDWFIEEAEKQNIDLTLIIREYLQIGIVDNKRTILYEHQSIHEPDIAIVRTIEPLLNEVLEDFGIAVFNSAYISRICNDKALTHIEVNKLEIPMVDTLFLRTYNVHEIPPIPYPFIVKSTDGHGGKNVKLIQHTRDWDIYLNSKPTGNIIIQTCDVQFGKDIRVFVVGKEIIGAVLRQSDKDFRANFTLGGTATWYNLSQSERKIVQTIINHFDFGMVGIDFLIDKQNNILFNEIEDVVGSRTLSKVSDINLLEHYVTWILRSLK
ncbi:RimK family alpha-L-glutamate ligase [Virgibacillus soli]|uniref:ATP-grasp domain-containing protein n=1 Tax=Paracerasibacillus soli TaxID=480284 RepID=A0ABU5CQF1_9BACI|nr:ATP-grasp domain-containing protein [Virgibacillus soli]MDY0408587.1 ATP-grasp domain-containing protein [Virgibacillus soli]